MNIEQQKEPFKFPIALWPSEKLAEHYWQPNRAYFPYTPWSGDGCFIFDNSMNVVIFDFIFDGKVTDNKEKWKRIDDRNYYLQARSPDWVNRQSGHAEDNAGFIVYSMYEWINALIKESNIRYVSELLKTLVDNGIIKSYTV